MRYLLCLSSNNNLILNYYSDTNIHFTNNIFNRILFWENYDDVLYLKSSVEDLFGISLVIRKFNYFFEEV